MRHVLIEIGFDLKSGNLAPSLTDENGDSLLKDPQMGIYPLQHGFVRLEGSSAQPMWPTQLEGQDQIHFRIFDITRDSVQGLDGLDGLDGLEVEVPQPQLFHAYFQNPNLPNSPRQLFQKAPVPIRAAAAGTATKLVPVENEKCPSHVFGYPEKRQSIRKLFHAWDVVGPDGRVFDLKVKPGHLRLERALMALALRVEHQGEAKDFFLDPELYVGPYDDDPEGRPPT